MDKDPIRDVERRLMYKKKLKYLRTSSIVQLFFSVLLKKAYKKKTLKVSKK